MLQAKLIKLTPAQRKCLASLTDDWREESADWKAGRVFLDLEERGLCEWEERRVSGGSVTTGPGNTSVYRWYTRRTADGVQALGDDFSPQDHRSNGTRDTLNSGDRTTGTT